ncbi:hypothetical protein Amsp01_039220 [Amycolatopsis sp. NBRC 101858]|uniref:hypothetical protein n=1 Tax=Amycolatopsis sp. NBRC 101858 TaxID=3032200 RepID=UPI0024A4D451|nr:hypothetical protein [Amycolatopsis sp. NBRC 101858]GLY37898.1 hypothetical protein Amsp01_039220 [Amycolatopsis sp. NBRC 101858]
MPTVPDTAAPAHRGAVALARGFLTGGVAGGTLSAFVVGTILERVPLILFALGLPLGYGVLLFAAGAPRRAREAAVVPRVALAKVESLRAGGTETGDVPVDLVLTVAPDDAPSYRVEVTHHVNLVDLPGFRRGDVVVVEYPPDRPWQARIVPRPAPEWARRRAGAALASAPESALLRTPPEGCASGAATSTGLLLAAAVVLVLFRAELFGPETTERPPEPPATSVTSSSGSATVTVGPDRTLLDAGGAAPGRRLPGAGRGRFPGAHRGRPGAAAVGGVRAHRRDRPAVRPARPALRAHPGPGPDGGRRSADLAGRRGPAHHPRHGLAAGAVSAGPIG